MSCQFCQVAPLRDEVQQQECWTRPGPSLGFTVSPAQSLSHFRCTSMQAKAHQRPGFAWTFGQSEHELRSQNNTLRNIRTTDFVSWYRYLERDNIATWSTSRKDSVLHHGSFAKNARQLFRLQSRSRRDVRDDVHNSLPAGQLRILIPTGSFFAPYILCGKEQKNCAKYWHPEFTNFQEEPSFWGASDYSMVRLHDAPTLEDGCHWGSGIHYPLLGRFCIPFDGIFWTECWGLGASSENWFRNGRSNGRSKRNLSEIPSIIFGKVTAWYSGR